MIEKSREGGRQGYAANRTDFYPFRICGSELRRGIQPMAPLSTKPPPSGEKRFATWRSSATFTAKAMNP